MKYSPPPYANVWSASKNLLEGTKNHLNLNLKIIIIKNHYISVITRCFTLLRGSSRITFVNDITFSEIQKLHWCIHMHVLLQIFPQFCNVRIFRLILFYRFDKLRIQNFCLKHPSIKVAKYFAFLTWFLCFFCCK